MPVPVPPLYKCNIVTTGVDIGTPVAFPGLMKDFIQETQPQTRKSNTSHTKCYRHQTPRGTILALRAFGFNLRISIEGWRQTRQRRTVALVIFRALKPVLRQFTSAKLWHHYPNGDWIHYEMNRNVSTRQALSMADRLGRIGFMVRMRRQKFGLTQEDLGKSVGMHRVHISRIEHGRHNLHPEMRRRIEKILALNLSEDPVYSLESD